eukprot:3687368-Rhodomonas_salina.1
MFKSACLGNQKSNLARVSSGSELSGCAVCAVATSHQTPSRTPDCLSSPILISPGVGFDHSGSAGSLSSNGSHKKKSRHSSGAIWYHDMAGQFWGCATGVGSWNLNYAAPARPHSIAFCFFVTAAPASTATWNLSTDPQPTAAIPFPFA